MRKAPVIDELDDNGLFIFGGFEFLKSIRPKEMPKVLRQSRLWEVEVGIHGHSHKVSYG
jgi:hypothetical protein